MATQMTSVINSGSATARQSAAASGSGGRNLDRNNGDRRGPDEGKVKKAKKKGQWCVFCRRWGHDAAKCRVGARVLATVAVTFQNQEPPPPPRPPNSQNRPRMEGPNSRERRAERRRLQHLQQQMEEDQQRQLQGQEDEREQRVDSPQGEEKDTTREADCQ